ncbi:protein of unknown function [Thauera humireducens]|nr:protein of unknown function [Thauera humireducens]
MGRNAPRRFHSADRSAPCRDPAETPEIPQPIQCRSRLAVAASDHLGDELQRGCNSDYMNWLLLPRGALSDPSD